MNTQLPAYIANRQGRGIAQQAAAGIMSSQPARISIAGNRFTRIDSAGQSMPMLMQYPDPRTGQLVSVPAHELRIIVVGANPHASKIYFEGTYDASSGDNLPPTCWSDNGVAPSAQVEAAKVQSTTCALCPHNAFGTSRINGQLGGKGKACADKKKTAVRLAPEWGDDTIYQLQIPPASLKDLAAYMKDTAQQDFGGRPADTCDVITVVSFEQGQVGKLNFTWGGFYDDAFAASIDNDLNTKADKIAWVTGINDVPRTAGLHPSQIAAPQQPAPLQVTHQPAPAPVYVQPHIPMGPASAAPAQPVYAPVQPQQQYPAPQPQQPVQPPRQRRPRAGKGGVGQEQPAAVVAHMPQAQPQPVMVQPVQQPVGAPAFLQSQPVQQPVAQPTTNFGMQAQPQLTSDDVAAKIAAAMAS